MKHLDPLLHSSATGGSRIGWSMISLFDECEMRWFIRQAVPHPAGGHGVGGRGSARALWVGSRVHTALEAWLRSSPGNAQYCADTALAALELDIREAIGEAFDAAEGAKWAAQAVDITRRYTLECGPSGPDPDGDRFRVAFDEAGEPLIEREFAIDLGYEGLYYTTRIDCIGWDTISLRGHEPPRLLANGTTSWDPALGPHPALVIVEHKTMDVTRASAALRGYALDPQIAGEVMAVRSAWPSVPVVIPVINAIKKCSRGRVQGLQRAWEPVHRDATDLAKFRIDVLKRVRRMDAAVGEFNTLREQGIPLWEAADLVFDGSPKGFTCADQGRQCPYYNACFRRAHRSEWLATTEPRFLVEGEE